jgi:hypothetical protein
MVAAVVAWSTSYEYGIASKETRQLKRVGGGIPGGDEGMRIILMHKSLSWVTFLNCRKEFSVVFCGPNPNNVFLV